MKRPPAPPLPPKLDPIIEDPPHRTRREWENRANAYLRSMKKYFRKTGSESRLDMTPAMTKRKVNAILDTIQKVEQRYASWPGWDLEENPNGVGETWLNLNLLPCTTYNSQERGCYMMYAAAIWILDQIMKERQNRLEILRWLPRDDHVIDEIESFPSCWDCNYEFDLIMSVVWVLCHRNDDIAPMEEDAFGKDRVWTNDLTAQDLHHADVPSRRNFEGLLGMIPRESVDQAVERFKELATAWTDRYYAGLGYLELEKQAVKREINEAAEVHNREREHLRELVSEITERLSRKQNQPKKPSPPQFNPLLVKPIMPQDMSSVHQMMQQFSLDAGIPGENFGKHRMGEWDSQYDGDADIAILSREADRMDQLQQAYFDRTKKMEGVLERKREYIDIMSRNGYITPSKAEELSVSEAGDTMVELKIEDPYELCFALLYLLDQGDDLPWLCGVGTGLMYDITERLPWGIFEYEEMDDPVWEDMPPEEEAEQLSFLEAIPRDEKAAKRQGILPDLYERGYVPKDADEAADRRSLAQIIYEETGCVLPRDMDRYDIRWKALKRDYGVGKKDANTLLYLMNILGNARRRIHAMNFDETAIRLWEESHEEMESPDAQEIMEEDPEDTLEQQQEKIRKLQAEIRMLQGSLHASEKNNRDAMRLLEQERENAAREHRELVDLREYVFTGEHESDPGEVQDADTAENEALSSCELQKDTVIFGGHDTWLKAIRPMLKGRVRFIDKDLLTFDTGVIRHADVIWIQPNALSHSQYYRIIETARKHGKQVRYFTNASAAIGARQVVQSDQEKVQS